MRQKRSAFLTGFLCGAVLFGATGAYAAGVLAEPSTQKVVVNGKNVAVQGYNIGGSNYFKLRDLGKALDVAVNFDEGKNQIRVQSDQSYGWHDPAISAPESDAKTEEPQPSMELADVSVRYDKNGRPLPYAAKVGQVIYGTGNVTRSDNPYAAEEYDGYMEIQEY